MSGTKAIWITAILLLGAAALVAFLPDSKPDRMPDLGPRQPPQVAPPAAPVAPPSAPAAPAQPAKKTPVQRAPNAVDLGMDQTIKGATVVAGNIVPMKDSATGEEYLLADGKYQIRGKGTQESPYRVSWECLASAQETFIPRLNELEMPQRVAMLNGKWVQIDGYLAFPLLLAETSELLIMLNQWDGCCIGVPPTPYDAIEMKLEKPARRTGGHAMFSFGRATGVLRVEPYLADTWLVGLYVLDRSALNQNAQPEL